ncbi:hypothetical protein TBLA_0B03180 [Henningerozyma blattae CBS 6284]|uniref:C3HC-type domain-containing protein n=1 Tax=Henningerozyma blattae (strain ATCC 34711 / CBS 6284 / DSM 70876 / NBRC 10599 / NRRL Y-10934 / UCD 77-7) TaxID=1071380 RepID=I2GYF7_HENB6|nr:hypothetical protein TBLA_0B03180 [Tetrapisispora blattae CBS 6284]CCH59159.1 hypothetical protein TBLA_0B03180 [Tetrapisispora blattae CBS 6284]
MSLESRLDDLLKCLNTSNFTTITTDIKGKVRKNKVPPLVIDPTTKILIRKCAYKTINVNNNKFLKKSQQSHLRLFENLIDNLVIKYPNFQLFNLDSLIQRLYSILNLTSKHLLNWDRTVLTPITLSSNGWNCKTNNDTIQNDSLICSCESCDSKFLLDFLRNGTAKETSLKEIMNTHFIDCPWRFSKIDLQKVYYINNSNLIEDINRIDFQLQKFKEKEIPLDVYDHQYLKVPQVLHDFFKCRNSNELLLLFYLLKGFNLNISKSLSSINLHCKMCNHQIGIRKFMDDVNVNYHLSWCRYSNPNQLCDSLETLINDSKENLKNIKVDIESNEDMVLKNNTAINAQRDQSNDHDEILQDRMNKLSQYLQNI